MIFFQHQSLWKKRARWGGAHGAGGGGTSPQDHQYSQEQNVEVTNSLENMCCRVHGKCNEEGEWVIDHYKVALAMDPYQRTRPTSAGPAPLPRSPQGPPREANPDTGGG